MDFNPRYPAPARMYDYYLGGKDWLSADAIAAEEVLRRAPEVRVLAEANRRFLVQAVRHLTAQGIDQFLDLGTGIPTSPNVHEVAREADPHARVVYVDNDPVVLAHNRALRDTPDGVHTIEGDVRKPDGILAHPEVRELIDFTRPVAVLAIAVLHFVADAEDPAAIVRVLHTGTAPGSYLAASLAVADEDGMARARNAAAVYDDTQATAAAHVRTVDAVRGLFGAWQLLDPGLSPVDTWPAPAQIRGLTIAGGLAQH